MDISNAQGFIHVRLQLAQEKRLYGAARAVQREQSGKTCAPVLTEHASRTLGFCRNKPRRLCGYKLHSISLHTSPFNRRKGSSTLRLATIPRLPSGLSSQLYQHSLIINRHLSNYAFKYVIPKLCTRLHDVGKSRLLTEECNSSAHFWGVHSSACSRNRGGLGESPNESLLCPKGHDYHKAALLDLLDLTRQPTCHTI